MHKISSIFDSMGKEWDELASHYDEEQIALLLEFLKKGWAYEFVFDDQTFTTMGNDVRMQSSGYEVPAPCYDIEIAGSANRVTTTSG
jgi:hypothetical protein